MFQRRQPQLGEIECLGEPVLVKAVEGLHHRGQLAFSFGKLSLGIVGQVSLSDDLLEGVPRRECCQLKGNRNP